MKIETTVEINKPPSEVYTFLMDEENLSLWIKNFIKLERLEGEDGQVGSTARHIYNENGRIIEFVEEVTAIRENELFEAILRNKHMNIQLRNELHVLADKGTRLVVESAINPKSIIARFMLLFTKRSMVRRQEEDLQRLKAAIEALGEEFES